MVARLFAQETGAGLRLVLVEDVSVRVDSFKPFAVVEGYKFVSTGFVQGSKIRAFFLV